MLAVCRLNLNRAKRMMLVVAIAASFRWPAHCQPVLLRLQVQVNRLNGDPVSGLRGHDFFLSDASGRLSVVAVQPSSDRAKTAQLPAMRVLMIFPSAAGFSDGREIARVILSSLTIPFGKAEIAVMRADGWTTPYAPSMAELVASVRSPSRFDISGKAGFKRLGEYPGRRAVVYFAGPHQSVPSGITLAAQQVSALVYQVGPSVPEASFSNEPSPAGLPFKGGPVTFDSSVEPHVGFPVLSGGYAPVQPEVAGGTRYHLRLDQAMRMMIRDGRGFYELSVLVSGKETKLKLGLARGQDYAMEAQAYTLGAAKVPELTLRQSEKGER